MQTQQVAEEADSVLAVNNACNTTLRSLQFKYYFCTLECHTHPKNWYVSNENKTLIIQHSATAVGWLLACLTSQQQASVSQGRICSDNFTCCHTEIEVADPTFYLTQSQYTDTGPTSPSADPITPGAWQGSHWSANF